MEIQPATTKEKIQETIISILQKNERFKDLEMNEKTHFDRDLHLTKPDQDAFIREVEVAFELTITSNAVVFIREIGQLVFYVDSQIFKG